MTRVYLDFETYSTVDIKTVGSYRYAEDISTEIILVGYAIDDSPVIVCTTHSPEIQTLLKVISGATVVAHNINFERLIWKNCGKKLGWPSIQDSQWSCTAARGRVVSLPGALADMAIALGLRNLKSKTGTALIAKYCKPGKKGRQYLLGNPEDYEAFKLYCRIDVEVSRELDKVLPELIPFEQKVFLHDLIVNDRGIPLDVLLLHKTTQIVSELERHFENKSLAIAGIKATQRNKVLEWLTENGLVLDNLQAGTVEEAITREDLSPIVKQFLEVRYESSRVGLKKIKKMLQVVCADNTAKGSFLYHSATTGRWGSKGIQLQNLGKPKDDVTQDKVLNLLANGTSSDMLKEFTRPMTAISQSMRGFIKANPGYKFLIVDYSSIEARVLSWLADEETLLKVYREGGDVYKTMASSIYNVPVSEITSQQRFMGKTSILGCGYGLGPKRFIESCRLMGVDIHLKEATRIIELYRESVPHITNYWTRMNLAAIKAVATRKPVKQGKCMFEVKNNFLHVFLPSGRAISYFEPRVEQNNWGKPSLVFSGFFNGKKSEEHSWGGLLVQNICQAVARDLLAVGMLTAEDNGYPICLTVHDELVTHIPEDVGSVYDFIEQVCKLPDWAKGLPLDGEGEACYRYKK